MKTRLKNIDEDPVLTSRSLPGQRKLYKRLFNRRNKCAFPRPQIQADTSDTHGSLISPVRRLGSGTLYFLEYLRQSDLIGSLRRGLCQRHSLVMEERLNWSADKTKPARLRISDEMERMAREQVTKCGGDGTTMKAFLLWYE